MCARQWGRKRERERNFECLVGEQFFVFQLAYIYTRYPSRRFGRLVGERSFGSEYA
jgi:hypothetical protein